LTLVVVPVLDAVLFLESVALEVEILVEELIETVYSRVSETEAPTERESERILTDLERLVDCCAEGVWMESVTDALYERVPECDNDSEVEPDKEDVARVMAVSVVVMPDADASSLNDADGVATL
jgi:hypothetical protein